MFEVKILLDATEQNTNSRFTRSDQEITVRWYTRWWLLIPTENNLYFNRKYKKGMILLIYTVESLGRVYDISKKNNELLLS